jgi:hypothetical protein
MFGTTVDRLLELLGVRRAGENGAEPLANDGMTTLFDRMVENQMREQAKPQWAKEDHGPRMVDFDGGGEREDSLK